MAEEKALKFGTTVAKIGSGDTLLVGTGVKSNSGSVSITPYSDSTAAILFKNAAGTTIGSIDTTNSRMRIGDATVPGANFDVAAGSTSVAPLRIVSGTLTTAPVPGALEYNGTWYITNGSGTRAAISTGGSLSGYTDTASPYNTAIGSLAADSPPSGTYNSAFGYNAGTALSTGNYHTYVGANAGASIASTHYGTAVGYGAFQYGTGSYNTAIGYLAYQGVAASTTGANNTIMGVSAFAKGTTGADNTAQGYNAALGVYSGSRNIAIGSYAIGDDSGSGTSWAVDQNVAVGYSAMRHIINCSYGVALGYQAHYYGAGANYNVAIGYNALYGATGASNDCSYNVAIGSTAGTALTTGDNNVFIGSNAGDSVTTGANNVVIGYASDLSAVGDTNEIVIGASMTGKGSNTGLIKSNTLYFGDGTAGTKTFYANDANANRGIRYTGTRWELTNDGTNWKAIAVSDASSGSLLPGWVAFTPTTDFSTTGASTSTITMNTDQSRILQQYIPVRIMDMTGVEYNDTSNRLSGWEAVTGLTEAMLDKRGAIYVNIVSAGGGNYYLNVYKDSGRTQLIAHTANFNSTGAKALVADNSSGVGGTITVDSVPTAGQTNIIVEYYLFDLVSSCTSSLLTLIGCPISTTAGRIVGLWYGSSERVHYEKTVITGQYAYTGNWDATLNVLFSEQHTYWPDSRLAMFSIWVYTIHATGDNAFVNIRLGGSSTGASTANSNQGLEVVAEGTIYKTGCDLAPKYVRGAVGGARVVWSTDAGVFEDTDSDLTVEELYILE